MFAFVGPKQIVAGREEVGFVFLFFGAQSLKVIRKIISFAVLTRTQKCMKNDQKQKNLTQKV